MSLAILFHFLRNHHVSDINISIIRSLRLCCWITTSVVLFLVRCVLEIWCGFSLQHGHHSNPATPNLQHTTNQEQKIDVVIQQHSCKLLMMEILISETCWVRKKWNKIASDMKLVFYSSKGHRFNDLGIGGWTVLKWELNMREGMERFYLARTETSGSLF